MKEGIRINGQWLSKNTILNGGSDLFFPDPDILTFLQTWFDDNDYIEAKTSGSTGKPKIIRLYKKYAMASAESTLRYFSLKPDDKALLSMPAGYIAGRMMLVRALTGGLDLYTATPAAPPILPRMSLDFAAFTPHQFAALLESEHLNPEIQIKKIILGGSPVTEKILSSIPKTEGEIYETFGMTETYSHIALRKIYPEYQSFFEAVPGICFSQTNGHLIIDAPHLGIRNLQTNDRVELLSPVQFIYLGRADFVINSGGIKLYPEEIKKKLTNFLSQNFYITGTPHPELGQQVTLVIEQNFEQNDDFWDPLFSKALEKYEKPRKILYIRKIIRTRTGKINRTETLKEENILYETTR